MINSIQERGFARKTMEFEHSKIHDGRGYDCDIEFTLTGTAGTLRLKLYEEMTGGE